MVVNEGLERVLDELQVREPLPMTAAPGSRRVLVHAVSAAMVNAHKNGLPLERLVGHDLVQAPVPEGGSGGVKKILSVLQVNNGIAQIVVFMIIARQQYPDGPVWPSCGM